jgi:hypothetical protein
MCHGIKASQKTMKIKWVEMRYASLLTSAMFISSANFILGDYLISLVYAHILSTGWMQTSRCCWTSNSFSRILQWHPKWKWWTRAYHGQAKDKGKVTLCLNYLWQDVCGECRYSSTILNLDSRRSSTCCFIPGEGTPGTQYRRPRCHRASLDAINKR